MKATHSGHFEFKILRSPTVVSLVSTAVPQVKKLSGKFVLTSGYAGGPIVCPFKRLILETPLYQHLLLTMSSTPTSELNDAECEKGHVTQRPPIPYATSKAESTMKAS
jgi:hypothetical protein